jgi:hypothetical protein
MSRTLIAVALATIVVLAIVGAPPAVAERRPNPKALAANKSAAQAAAGRILAHAELPPGAVRSGSDRSLGGVLRNLGSGAQTTRAVVSHVRYWTVPGVTVGDVHNELITHTPAGAEPANPPTTVPLGVATTQYEFPASRGSVVREGLQYAYAAGANGGVALRVEGWAIWQILRSSRELIPVGTRSIRVRVIRPDNGRSVPVDSVSSMRQVNRIVTWVDQTPLASQGVPSVFSCPPPFYSQPFYELSFLARNGKVLARLRELGCPQDLGLSLHGGTSRLSEDAALGTLLWDARALDRCRASQLTVAAPLSASEDPTSVFEMLAIVKDSSGRVCSLRGVARATLEGPGHQPLPTKTSGPGPTAAVVTLVPGATAATEFRWPEPTPTCAPAAASLRLTIPSANATLTFSTAASSQPVAPCGGRMAISPIVPNAPAYFPPGSPHPQ